MGESQNIKKMRQTLYEEIWAEPMTIVAVRYGISDNGLRKRCQSMNIPWPPNGYWAKVKAGKPVVDRPPLPPFNETILSYESQGEDANASKVHSKKNKGTLELLELEELSVEQLTNMGDFDLLAPGSLENFRDWCNGLTVPGRIHDYDDLISKHKLEIEYREEREKEHPFNDDGIRLWSPLEKIKYRDNEAVIPIGVSSRQRNRAYRIVETILKAFRQLKGNVSIDRGKVDNIGITLLSTTLSFDLHECKTKRRYIADQTTEFKPLYEMIFDGRLQISWQMRAGGYYYDSEKTPSISISYIDASDNPLEKQISTMIIELYKQCCDNEISNNINYKRHIAEYDREKNERREKEVFEEKEKHEQKRQVKRNSLINDIALHSDNWFKHEQLSRYANELEAHMASYTDEETVRLLKEYIVLVRKNADKCNPLSHIIHEMRAIESQGDN